MSFTTTSTFLAAWLDAAGLVPYHADRTGAARRYYFHDSAGLREAEAVWKEWTGGRYRKSYKKLNRDG